MCVCSSVLAGSGGPASRANFGAPCLFLWPLCLSALLGPLRAGFALVLVLCLPSVPPFAFFFFPSFVRPRCLRLSLVSGPGCPGPWRCVSFVDLGLPLPGTSCALALFVSPAWQWAAPSWLLPPPPLPICVSRFSSLLLGALVFCFFFLPLCALVAFGFLWFLAPGALVLGAVRCLLYWPSVSRLSVRSRLFRAFRLAVGCSLVVAAPPPPPAPLCVSRFSSLPLGAVCRVLCCAVCPWVRCCAALLRVVPPCVVLPCVVLLCCARLVPLLVAPCPLALPVALGPCALRRCVLRCSPVLCALCCVCFVVAWWCVLLSAAVLCAVCVPGCSAVCSLSSPLCAVLCFAVLVRVRCAVRVVRAVAGAWCCGALLCVLCVVLFPLVCCGALLGLVARGCLLVTCLGVGVPVCPRGLLPCGSCGALWCPASLCCVLWCCAVAWCCAAVFCCRVAVLLGLVSPSCGLSCCAVLCCWLAVLVFAWWCCLRAVVLFPSCFAFPVFSALCAAVPCCAGFSAMLHCVVRCGALLSCGAVLSCSAVALWCCLCLLCPPVACGAAPCCAVLC